MAAYFNRRKSSHSMVNLNSFKLDIPRKDSDGSVGGDFMSPMDTTANRIFFVEKPVVNPPPQAHHNGIDSQLRPGLLPDTSQGSTLPNCSTASLPSFNSTSTLANSAASSPVHTNEKEKLNASGTVCPKCQYGSTTVQDSPKGKSK
ncbi:hypothetical protein IWQ62_001735 [Dispira parvispora]|uniref:Uncharacterized protein n=1 Tax=Dispira parvispora TaxID=1520584 RepID=A0A9W8E880_9FUNG|nr:hypothetical protein IWQ62_001735 [Dispira parvispora]